MNCKFCLKEVGNPGALSIHELACLENPNREYKPSKLKGRKLSRPNWNTGKKLPKHPKWEILNPDSKVFVENSTYSRHCLKKRILDKKLIDYICSICNIGPYWNEKPMPLVLDHINGVNNDNRLENLRFVCSNCDCQLPTYKSKNKKRVASSGG